MTSGKFIAFEGIDKSGKSTQAEMLADFLDSTDVDYILVSEPGSTGLGLDLRDLVLGTSNLIDARAEALIFYAARQQLLEERILPALTEGKLVICDRYLLSSYAYQGVGRSIGNKDLELLDSFIDPPMPDLTIILDRGLYPPPSIQSDSQDRMEAVMRADHGFLSRVYQCFVGHDRSPYPSKGWRFHESYEDAVTVNGIGSPDKVHERVLSALGSQSWWTVGSLVSTDLTKQRCPSEEFTRRSLASN